MGNDEKDKKRFVHVHLIQEITLRMWTGWQLTDFANLQLQWFALDSFSALSKHITPATYMMIVVN